MSHPRVRALVTLTTPLTTLRTVPLAATLTALMTVLAGTVASPAAAQRVDGGPYHEEFSDTYTDFCDSPGLTVDTVVMIDGHFLANARGPGGVLYFNDHQHITQTYTNPVTGLTAVDVQRIVVKDLKITRVGTVVTIVELATGFGTTYGPDDRVIARNPGQSRFRIVFDDNGTPDDDSDDTGISFDRVKGSTGRTDDFCAAVVPAIS